MNRPEWIKYVSPHDRGYMVYILKEIRNHCTFSQEYKNSYLEKVENYFKTIPTIYKVNGHNYLVPTEDYIKRNLDMSWIGGNTTIVLWNLISYFMQSKTGTGWNYVNELLTKYRWKEHHDLKITENDILENFTFIYQKPIKDFNVNDHIKHIYLNKKTRMAILRFMMEVYKIYEDSFKCREFKYIEKVAEKFDMADSLEDARNFSYDMARSILLNEEEDVFRLFKEFIGYLLGKDGWFLNVETRAFEIEPDDDSIHWIDYFLGEHHPIYPTGSDPLCNSIKVLHNINEEEFYIQPDNTQENLENITVEKDTMEHSVHISIENESNFDNFNDIFYKDL